MKRRIYKNVLSLIFLSFPTLVNAYCITYEKACQNSATANAPPCITYREICMRPVLSVGLGGAWTSRVGVTTNFPAADPVTDEFYNYSSTNRTGRSAMLNLFFGAQWTIHHNSDFEPDFGVSADKEFQLGLAYNQSSQFAGRGTLLQGADALSANTFTYHYGVTIRQVLVEGKAFLTVNRLYHPYLLAGVGAAFNKAYNYYTNVPANLTFTRLYSNNTQASFSYALGFGIDMDVVSNLRAGIGYIYTDAGRTVLNQATIDNVSVSGTLTQSHLYTQELFGQFSWVF